MHLKDGVDVADLEPYRPIVSPGDAGEGRTILVEGPKFVLERWSRGRAVDLPAGTTAWLIPIKGEGEVAGVAWQAGECVTVEGSRDGHRQRRCRPAVRLSGDEADLARAAAESTTAAAAPRITFAEPERLHVNRCEVMSVLQTWLERLRPIRYPRAPSAFS